MDDKLAPSFLELMKNVRRVKIERVSSRKKENGSERRAILNGIKSGLEEVKQAREGKIRLQSAREFLRDVQS